MLVVDRALEAATRRSLLQAFLRISGAPGRRPLEVTIFAQVLASASYPPESQFVYGEWLRAAFEAGNVPEPHRDADHTILLAQARRASRPLTGPEANLLVPAVPDEELPAAIGAAVTGLLTGLEGDERNVLLTLARMWCTLQTGMIVPKYAAAAWAEARLSDTARAFMEAARLGYLGLAQDDWTLRRAGVELVARGLGYRIALLIRSQVNAKR